jgi:hypothetical protein
MKVTGRLVSAIDVDRLAAAMAKIALDGYKDRIVAAPALLKV